MSMYLMDDGTLRPHDEKIIELPQETSSGSGSVPCCAFVLRHFPKPCRPTKEHHCRLCGETISAKEPCCRWDGIIQGQGRFTSHAHPECYAVTDGWDSCDWESTHSGDLERPQIKMSWHNAESRCTTNYQLRQ